MRAMTFLSIHGARTQVRADCLNVSSEAPRSIVPSALCGLASTADVVGATSRRPS